MTLAIFAAAAVATATPSVSNQCRGHYSYIPRDREKEVPFSVEVQPTSLKVQYLDFSSIFAERQNKPDGIIQIYDRETGGVNHWLVCNGSTAVFVSDRTEYDPLPTVVRLVRTSGDIFQVAKEHNWPVDD